MICRCSMDANLGHAALASVFLHLKSMTWSLNLNTSLFHHYCYLIMPWMQSLTAITLSVWEFGAYCSDSHLIYRSLRAYTCQFHDKVSVWIEEERMSASHTVVSWQKIFSPQVWAPLNDGANFWHWVMKVLWVASSQMQSLQDAWLTLT